MTKTVPPAADLAVIASALALPVTAGKVSRRMLLAPFGEFNGRDGRGPYVLEDRSHAEQVIAATKAFKKGADFLVNYDHQSEFAAVQGVGGKAPAAGWIKLDTLAVDDAGIYGEVDWTPAAEASLQAREYRYHSPHFRVDPRTRRLTRLVNAGLTNSPNLDLPALASQEPGITPADPANPTQGNDMSKPVLAAALSSTALAALQLTADAADETVLAAIDTALAGKAKDQQVLASIRTKFKLADDAGEQAVLAAVESGAGNPDPAKYVPVDALKGVTDELAQIREEKVLHSVDQAVEQGKLAPALKDWAIDLGKKDLAALQSYLGTAPAFDGAASLKGEPPATEKGKLNAEEQAICAQLGLSETDFLKSRDGEVAARNPAQKKDA